MEAFKEVARGLVQLRVKLSTTDIPLNGQNAIAFASSFVRAFMWEFDELMPYHERETTRRSPSQRSTYCLNAMLTLYDLPSGHHVDAQQQRLHDWFKRVHDDEGAIEGGRNNTPTLAGSGVDDISVVDQGLALVSELSRKYLSASPDFSTLLRAFCANAESLTAEQVHMLYERGDAGADAVRQLLSAVITEDTAAYDVVSATLPFGKWFFVANRVILGPFDSEADAVGAAIRCDTSIRHPFGVHVIRCVGQPLCTSECKSAQPLMSCPLSSATERAPCCAGVDEGILVPERMHVIMSNTLDGECKGTLQSDIHWEKAGPCDGASAASPFLHEHAGSGSGCAPAAASAVVPIPGLFSTQLPSDAPRGANPWIARAAPRTSPTSEPLSRTASFSFSTGSGLNKLCPAGPVSCQWSLPQVGGLGVLGYNIGAAPLHLPPHLHAPPAAFGVSPPALNDPFA